MKIARLPAFFGLIAILVSSIGAAENAKSVSISGMVQDEMGQPAADAIVESSYAGKRYATKTDAEGVFSIEVEMPQARAGGDKLFLPVHVCTSDGKLHAFGAVGPGVQKPLLLKTPREFPITVNDADGKPVAGAQIMASSDFINAGDAVTDAAGKAILRISASATPDYILAVKSGVGLDYRLFWRKDAPKTDPYGLEQGFTGPLTFTLNGMVKVDVEVKDEQGQPVSGVSLYPWYFIKPGRGDHANLGGLSVFQRVSDDRGRAEIEIPADNERPVNVWARLEGYTSRKRWMYDVKNDKGPLAGEAP